MAERHETVNELVMIVQAEIEAGRGESDTSRAAFDKLAEFLTPVLLARALAKVGNYTDAEAITQEVIVGLWRAILRYRGRIGRPQAYISKIFRNTIADHWELRKGSERRRPEPVLAARSLDDEAENLPLRMDERAEDPADAAARSEACEIICSSIEGLGEEDGEIALRVVHGQSLQEVADDMGIGKGKVRYRFDRFADNMRRTLGES